MMQAKQPIGVIDSGVGGLTVLKWLQAKLPHEDFIFIGDTARTPYGNRPREEITRFVGEMTDWLDKRHIKQLVVACNTITVLGLDVIKGNHSFDVIGMAKGARMVPGVTKNNRVGFLPRISPYPPGPTNGKSSGSARKSRYSDRGVPSSCR